MLSLFKGNLQKCSSAPPFLKKWFLRAGAHAHGREAFLQKGGAVAKKWPFAL